MLEILGFLYYYYYYYCIVIISDGQFAHKARVVLHNPTSCLQCGAGQPIIDSLPETRHTYQLLPSSQSMPDLFVWCVTKVFEKLCCFQWARKTHRMRKQQTQTWGDEGSCRLKVVRNLFLNTWYKKHPPPKQKRQQNSHNPTNPPTPHVHAQRKFPTTTAVPPYESRQKHVHWAGHAFA